MFRMSFLSCVVLAVVAQGSFSQDKKVETPSTIPRSTILNLAPTSNPAPTSYPFPKEQVIPDAQPELLQALSAGESEPPKVEKKKNEWAPAMRVFLNEAPGVQAVVQNKTETRSVPVTRYKSTQQNGKVYQVPVTTIHQVPQVTRSVTAGTTIIDCGDVNVQVGTSEKGPKAFEFEIKGKLQLQNGSTLIEAKSAKLVDGKLTLTDVTLHTDSMKMTCAELVLDMQVNALRVGEVNEPVAPKSAPVPTPGFSPFDSPRPVPTPAASFGNPFPGKPDSSFKKKTPDDVFKN